MLRFFRLKKLDSLVLGSMLPPFITSFFIALFVLTMQFLWLWIDELIGKGVNILIILELLGYLLVFLIPWAIPIAILISSVMVFGNMGEYNELTSFKSAGVPLLRMMRMAIVFGVFAGVFTFLSADYFVPVANLKYRTRLFDIRKQKPTLSIESGIFNYDFQGFTIRVEEKSPNNRDLKGVLIYDYTSSNPSKVNIISADSGEMFTTANERYLKMRLYNGHQISETEKKGQQPSENSQSFMRTSFETWEKTFDLSEFEISRSDEEGFKSHQAMMNGRQLLSALDTINQQIFELDDRVLRDTERDFYTVLKAAEVSVIDIPEPPGLLNIAKEEVFHQKDTIDWANVEGFHQTFPDSLVPLFVGQARAKIIDSRSRLTIMAGSIFAGKENAIKHRFEYHLKFCYGLICIVFLFIGASMGAIVRKGGYGYPLLIAIVFFVIFITLNFTFKKLAETMQVDDVLAAWFPALALMPFAVFFTYKAQRDAKFVQISIPTWLRRKKKAE